MSKENAIQSSGRICPPPPPKIGPLCLAEQEKDSDLSSVSDLEEDFDLSPPKTSGQKFEEVSESELEISEDERRQTPPRDVLENIDSDENDQTSLSSISDDEAFPDPDQSYCDRCLLVFKNAEALAKHLTSRGHLEQTKRGKDTCNPSTVCLLCSMEFQTLEELQRHEEGDEHLKEMTAQQVLSCHAKVPTQGRPPKRKPVTQYKAPPKKMALKKFRSSPERVDDSLACYLCNLVFVSQAYQQKHLTSESHRKNANKLQPPLCESWYSYFSTGNHYCYPCWIGYNNVKDLIKHYTRPSHLNLFKSLGILRIYLDERYVHKSLWHSAEKYRSQIIYLKNFTEVDRIGECDTSSETFDVGFISQVKSASVSKSTAQVLIADTEAVSSDEASDISDSELDNLESKASDPPKGNVLVASQLDLQDVSD